MTPPNLRIKTNRKVKTTDRAFQNSGRSGQSKATGSPKGITKTLERRNPPRAAAARARQHLIESPVFVTPVSTYSQPDPAVAEDPRIDAEATDPPFSDTVRTRSGFILADARSRSVESDGKIVYVFEGPPYIVSYKAPPPGLRTSDWPFWDEHPNQTTADVSWAPPSPDKKFWTLTTTLNYTSPDGKIFQKRFLEYDEDTIPPFDIICEYGLAMKVRDSSRVVDPRILDIDFATLHKSGHRLLMPTQADEAATGSHEDDVELFPTVMRNELSRGPGYETWFPQVTTVSVFWTPPVWDGTDPGQYWTKRITFQPRIISGQSTAPSLKVPEQVKRVLVGSAAPSFNTLLVANSNDGHQVVNFPNSVLDNRPVTCDSYVPEEIWWEFLDIMASRLPETSQFARYIRMREPIPWVSRGHTLCMPDLPSPGHMADSPTTPGLGTVARFARMFPRISYEERFLRDVGSQTLRLS